MTSSGTSVPAEAAKAVRARTDNHLRSNIVRVELLIKRRVTVCTLDTMITVAVPTFVTVGIIM